MSQTGADLCSLRRKIILKNRLHPKPSNHKEQKEHRGVQFAANKHKSYRSVSVTAPLLLYIQQKLYSKGTIHHYAQKQGQQTASLYLFNISQFIYTHNPMVEYSFNILFHWLILSSSPIMSNLISSSVEF